MSEKTVKNEIMSVPLLDLDRQYAPIREEILKAFETVFDEKQFIQGPQIKELETEIASYCECKQAIGVSSGTDALLLALMALDIGPGDEVITSPFTFFATAGCIARVGATPVFADIDPKTFNIDPTQIESKITSKTKAIMPVHLFGQMCDMEAIMAIAKKNNLAVIEDAAQAIGSRMMINGKLRMAGSIGDIGCFSFFPSKNLGCCGDGGIVTTNSSELAEKMRVLRVHGSKPKYYHHLIGGNFRLDTVQAAILLVKLPYLEEQHEGRRAHAAVYDKAFEGIITTPFVAPTQHAIYNQYTLQTNDREALIEELNAHQIGNAIYYPVPLHLQQCFTYLGHKEGDFPHSERATKTVLSIPIYPELREDETTHVANVILNFVKKRKECAVF